MSKMILVHIDDHKGNILIPASSWWKEKLCGVDHRLLGVHLERQAKS